MRFARLTALATLALALLAGPLAAEAQITIQRVGVVHAGGPYAAVVEGLQEGLRQLGLADPKSLTLLVRETRVDPKEIEGAVQSLVREKVNLIYAIGTSIARPAKRATGEVPIVFSVGTDPVASGLVESAARPGGRLTGNHYLTTDLTEKRLEILREILPRLRRVLIFYNPANPTPRESVRLSRQAAQKLRIELVERHVGSSEELREGLQALRAGEVDAFFYVADATVGSQAQAIIDAAKAIRLPTMFHERTIVAQGALASYGVNYHEIGRLSAKYVQRVLAGADPKDLPIENIDRLEFVVNLRTAKELGISVPRSIVNRADHVIK
jgi:putative ABC transport system substrate-binding protein